MSRSVKEVWTSKSTAEHECCSCTRTIPKGSPTHRRTLLRGRGGVDNDYTCEHCKSLGELYEREGSTLRTLRGEAWLIRRWARSDGSIVNLSGLGIPTVAPSAPPRARCETCNRFVPRSRELTNGRLLCAPHARYALRMQAILTALQETSET